MSLITLPVTLTNGTTGDATQVMSDLNTIVAVVNGQLDSTNISAARGIGANFITPSGSGATGVFGPGAYSISSLSTSQVPLTLNGIGGQTSDLLDLSVAGVVKASFSATGLLSVPGVVNAGYEIFTGSTGAGASAAWMSGTAGSGLQINVATGKVVNFTVNGSGVVSIGPALLVGSGNTGASPGDGAFGRNASSGAIFLGGNTSSATIDYGVTSNGKLTIAASTNISGPITATSFNGSGSGLTGIPNSSLATTPLDVSSTSQVKSGQLTVTQLNATGAIVAGSGNAAGFSAGDVAAARSATGGLLLFGGTERGALDYGITTAHVFSFTAAGPGATNNVVMGGLTAASGAFTGAVTGASAAFTGAVTANGAHVAPVFTAAGADAGNVHMSYGTATVSGGVVTVTLSGSDAFSGAGSYTVQVVPTGTNSATICSFNVYHTSGTSFTIYVDQWIGGGSPWATYSGEVRWVAIGT